MHAISIDKMEEYMVLFSFTAVIWLSALMAVFIQSDLIIITVTVGAVVLLFLFIEEIKPLHLFYTICFGASFFPYINLQMFPLAGIYVVTLLFILLSIIVLVREGEKVKLPTAGKWLIAFLAIGLFSIVRAPDKKQVIVGFAQFFMYVGTYIAAVNLLKKKTQMIQALKYVFYGAVFPLFYSFLQLLVSAKSLHAVIDIFYQSILGKLFIGSKGMERMEGFAMVLINRASNLGGASDDVLFRIFGTYISPTSFGTYLMLITVIAGALFIVQYNKKRVAITGLSDGVIFSVLLVALLLTWTRGAWLAFFIAMAFIVVYRKAQNVALFTAKNIKLFLFIVVMPLLLFLVLLVLKVPIATSVLTSIVSLKGASNAHRIVTMLFALQYIVHNPILGTGWGNYRYIKPGFVDTSTASFGTAHNRFLELGAELGLPGLIAYLGAIYFLVKQTFTLVKAPLNSFYHTLGIAFLALWIGFIMKSMFEGSVIHPRTMTLLWALAAIQTAVYNKFNNEKQKEHTVYRAPVAGSH